MVSPHAAHSNGRLSWSGLSGGLIRASHVGAPHLAQVAISASFRPYGCGRRHCTRKSGFLALVRASQRSLSIPVCRRSVGTDKNAGASRHLVQTDLFSHGCKARWSNSRRRLAMPPACRDDGSVSCIDTRHARLVAMCNIEQSANET